MILDDNEVALAEPEFDQPAQPVRRFGIIAATARSGSHMLCRLLRQAGLGVPLEYFYPDYRARFESRWRTTSPQTYLSAVMENRTAGGYCLVKCLTNQYPPLMTAIGPDRDLPRPFIIHLWRRDSLAQAISLRLAVQSGFWNFTAEPTTVPRADIAVDDLSALCKARQRLIVDELLWRAWLRETSWPVIHVCYEDLVADRETELRRLLEWLEPGRGTQPLPDLREPPTPDGLHQRQSLGPTERAALAAAYRAQFGQETALPAP